MNKKILSAVLAASLAIIFFDLRAAAQGEIPFRVKKMTDRITIFSPGQYAPEAATTVITTAKGLIVIDTGLSPTLAELTRKKIKQELGRDDVIYVINTHDHFDHTDGNQVYVGATIVGHENAGAAIRRFAEGRSAFIASRRNRIVQLENRLKTLQTGSPDALATEKTIRFDLLMTEDLEKRYIPTPPTKTFNDRMTLAVGDLELKLYSYGRAHTDSDILVHIPRLGILFVGDLFFPTSLLASANAAAPPDVPRWLEVLGEVMKNKDEVKTVIGGHGHSFAPEWLAAQHRYFQELWGVVTKAKNEGLTPEAADAQNPLGQKFAFLGPFFDLKSKEALDSHRQNIQLFWRSGMKPAAGEIERIIRQSGPEAGRARFKELRTQLAREFFVDERAFNALGYQFLRERKIPEAVAVFEMNTEAFPESWNVWDSLAEGYANSRDNDKAEAYYNKSLVLNPNNDNARANLSQIRGYKLDAQGETKEAFRFRSGEQTGLQGAYLGQSSPGLEPKVFAPGIISAVGHFEFSITFSPDGKEVYFTRRKDQGGLNTMMVSRLEKDGWTASEEASFCKGYPSNEPHITPDGQKLYFGCNRQRPGADRAEYGIWVTERKDGGWGEPRYHGPGMYVSASRNGNLYMTDVTNVAGGGALCYPFANGRYGAPQRLTGSVNAPTEVAHAFIAPDESFIVFDSYNRPGGQGGEGDLWVCFKKTDGSWSEAYNLGDKINTPGTNFCPSLSPDGKFLFYATCRDIYWVSAEAITGLKPKDLK